MAPPDSLPASSARFAAWVARLWQRNKPEPATARDTVTLHCYGVDAELLHQLHENLGAMNEAACATLRLAQHEGEIALIDDAWHYKVRHEVLEALIEERPRVIVRRRPVDPHTAVRPIDLDDLLAQLRQHRRPASAPGAGQGASLDSGFDSGFDSSFDFPMPAPGWAELQSAAAGQTFLELVHAVKTNPRAGPLGAEYPGGGVLVIDSETAQVWVDQNAWTSLSLARGLPRLRPGAHPHEPILRKDLDQVLWLLGLAAGQLPLLEAPGDWWHAPLTPIHLQGISRYTRKPAHLEMARKLAQGGVTASQLRRSCRVSVSELRSFVQACLLLSLVWWRPMQPLDFVSHHGRHRLGADTPGLAGADKKASSFADTVLFEPTPGAADRGAGHGRD